MNHAAALHASLLNHRLGPMLLVFRAANLMAQKLPETRAAPNAVQDLVSATDDSGTLGPIQSTTWRAAHPENRKNRRELMKSGQHGKACPGAKTCGWPFASGLMRVEVSLLAIYWVLATPSRPLRSLE